MGPAEFTGQAQILLKALNSRTSSPQALIYDWADPECAIVPTLYFDVVLDIFFLVDILYNFNTGVILPGGEYIDDWMRVAWLYIKGMFLFDIVTSFPVSFFELAAASACASADGVQPAVDGGQLRMIRVLKPLRWFKLARIVKLKKADQIMNAVADYFLISPRQSKTVKVNARTRSFAKRCTPPCDLKQSRHQMPHSDVSSTSLRGNLHW